MNVTKETQDKVHLKLASIWEEQNRYGMLTGLNRIV